MSRSLVPERLNRASPWFATLLRLALAGVWFWAGWPKLLDTEGTVRSVRAFQLLPEALVRPFAYGLPALELVLGILLVIGLGTRLSSALTGALMVMFIFGIAMAWGRGLSIQCGCFGSSSEIVTDPVPGYIKDILRDIGLFAMAAFLVWRPHSRFSLDGLLGVTKQAPSPTSSDRPHSDRDHDHDRLEQSR
jgi:uncharacterized membrane protein YphA (DoxX/SURF4 family)